MIKEADKWGVIIIMDAEYYKHLTEDKMKDTTFYCEILTNIDHHITTLSICFEKTRQRTYR